MGRLTQLPAWQALQKHYQSLVDSSMQEWFADDPSRFAHFSLSFKDILFDFSKNRITADTLSLLCNLADEVALADKIVRLFNGNFPEKQPAFHTALRDKTSTKLPDIKKALTQMTAFTEEVRNKKWYGATGKPIRDIINIGIGGSHLGPLMTTHALKAYSTRKLRCFFISNTDAAQIHSVLRQIDPEKALFIISSKSFTTLETLENAKTVRTWLKNQLGDVNLSPHFVAVTAKPDFAKAWGIEEPQIFPLWEWIGGRYSIWSAIGLPLALMIGMKRFNEFLAGAEEMDTHFREAPFTKNIPVLLGLLGVWYINFFKCSVQAIVPYTYELNYFCDYVQQADMESNGKIMTLHNNIVEYATGAVVFGKQGCDSQHSYFQLLHQSPRLIPVDFILIANNQFSSVNQDILIASGLSQAEALMCGKSYEEAFLELLEENYSVEDASALAMHKTIPGNRPSKIS